MGLVIHFVSRLQAPPTIPAPAVETREIACPMRLATTHEACPLCKSLRVVPADDVAAWIRDGKPLAVPSFDG